MTRQDRKVPGNDGGDGAELVSAPNLPVEHFRADILAPSRGNPEAGVSPVPERYTAPSLTLWRTEAMEAMPVVQALAEGYDLTELKDLPPPGQLDLNGTQCLLLHLPPATVLCRAMAAGTAPAEALESWRGRTETLLAHNRRDRRNVRVLGLMAALAHPVAFREYFGLPQGQGPETPRGNDPDNLNLLNLAQRLLAEDPRSRKLMTELTAVSINLSGGAPINPAPVEAVFQAYRTQQNTEAALATVQKRNKELEQVAALETEKTRAAENAIRVLQAQTRGLHAELEIMTKRGMETAERADALAAEVASLREDVKRFYNSHSYRITRPLRSLRALLSGQKSL